ncbi:NLR family CARD domain-containing protein 3 isoform X1 [Hippoglossus stenolepis]|uniref:NLR family CARD domain-containing protein 3 isoform X1 n=1 Tax=Hippoglossus stenolepis TaxID=195615 RepID=UPI00159BFE82|nr:NLR family CARD domain-containing protein 3 isoform X1 [Hippoglossus stenolepis]
MDDVEQFAMAMGSDSSSVGDAVSGRGQQIVSNEEDDLYYIPERRPSLDLGQWSTSPMDTSHGHHVGRAPSPVLSYISLASEESSIEMGDGEGSSTGIQLERSDSFSSCYSFDSDDCEKIILKSKSKDDMVSGPFVTPEFLQSQSESSHPSLTVAFTLQAICGTLRKLSAGAFKTFKMMLWKHYPQSFNTPHQDMDMLNLVDRLLECYRLDVSLQITKIILGEMGEKKVVDYLQTMCLRNEVRHELCETLKRIYGEVCEDMAVQEEKRPFDDIFTDLYITSTCDNGPNIEHEVMTIEKLDSNRNAEKRLSTKDIFTPERPEDSNTKLLLMTGVAGSGKSMAVRRLVLDWIEGRSHQHVSFLFPLPFRELKQFEDSTASFLEIIQKLYPESKKLRDEDYRCEDCKIMFVFDGLDEYNGKLDFENTMLLSDHTEPTTLNVIVVNLLRGRLLYRGLFLVTSRPQVKPCIPWDTHYDEIEVRGFCDPEKEAFFKRRFKDPDQAARVIAYIKSFRTLCIMCHLPLFCSLVADECYRIFREQGTGAELPRSITYLYTKLVLVLTRQHRILRAPDLSLEEERDFLMKLGELAFHMLEEGQFKITRSNWKHTGINDKEAVINSGLCTQYITKPHVLFHENVLSFIHPTVQEYLAALYVFLSFRNHGKNVVEQQLRGKLKMFKGHKVMELYKSAVDRSMLSEDGKMDIFLRFLLGMERKPNLELLQPLCASSVKWPTVIEETATLIRKRIRENKYPCRNDNLQHCLEELGVC